MKMGLYCSLLLHLVALAFLFLGFPLIVSEMNQDYAIIAEVVPVSELTNVKIKSSDKAAEQEKEAKKSSKAPETKKPEESKTSKTKDAKQADAEKVPDKNVKDKKDKKVPQKIEEKTDDAKKKKTDDTFAKSILKTLEQDAKKNLDAKADKDFKELEKSLKGETNKEYNPNLPMTISEIDGIKSQIISKWNTASFSGSAEKGMQVIVKIELDMEGKVISAMPIADNNSSPYYRAFVESAVRAVKMASPIQNLSKEKYHTWKDIEFRFDSSGMIY
ncbi:MAG: hypothetical protein K0R73_586 [Candidatus Midichloriaceae bacterium]|jgi:outer membrane biosynthesis protein TonB|nr:hypothetical protein [Candidatus Midichloriaceae bacterium]